MDILTKIISNNDDVTEFERITEHITPNRHVKKYVKENFYRRKYEYINK